MTDIAGQKASSSAIVEKRPQRPGGCVGIFFQLLDWNKRLAKRKLFSKKFLPPVRLIKPSKKFGGDEKQPRLRLIVDENKGVFPHVKKNDEACNVDAENKNEMQAPGLVARLMGLESMPAVSHDKSKKASLSGAGCNDGEKILDGYGRLEQEELNVEKGEIKQELRPQKLQKTGLSERRPMTRIGAEALQLKNVLSRSRKYHENLVSPVKSPQNVSGRNASRLICAATRILEPGLHRSRSKCALTCSNAADHPPTTKALMEEAIDLEPLENSNYFQSSAKPVNILQSSSSRNCSHLLDVVDVGPSKGEQLPVFSPVSQSVNSSCQVSETGSRKHHILCPELGKRKSEEDAQLHAAFVMEDRQPCAHYVSDKNLLNRAGQRQRPATSKQNKIPKDVSSLGSGHKTQGESQMFKVRERLPSRSKVSGLKSNGMPSVANAANEGKNFVSLNGNLRDHPRLRRSAKEDSNWIDTVQRIGERREDSLSSAHKRISTNSSRQKQDPTFVSSFAKPTTVRSNTISRKDGDCASHSPIEPCSNNRLANLQESINANSVRNYSDVISFTFKSPMKHKTGIHIDVEARRNQNCPDGEDTLKKSAFNENDGKGSHLKSFPLSGDSLGALLDQKLKELTCQEEDDSTFVDTAPKKSTAAILQELISALTTERPCHWDVLGYGGEQSQENSTPNSQAKPKSTKNSIAYLPYYEHLSPGSVLEASFSNDSCASSSLDDGSGCNLGVESTECCERPYLLEPDTDLLDSASSLSIGALYRELVINLLNNISELFNTINVADVHLKGSKLTHAQEVILNAELVFGNAALPDAIVNGGFPISHFIVNELEMLASVMQTSFSGLVAFTKEENQIKGFVFDCVIEYLESRFSRYSNSGFSTWSRLPLRLKTEILICEIIEEVGRWAELAGLITDELIEHDMGYSLGKWADFESETFDTGIEIDQQILQTLITEIVVDLTDRKRLCCC